jgi:hypothetical protein
MDNQHKHIKGYRDLTEAEVALMNRIKHGEAGVADLWYAVKGLLGATMMRDAEADAKAAKEAKAKGTPYDSHAKGNQDMLSYVETQRQLAMARTHFEQGFSHLIRAVAKPESPWVRSVSAQAAKSETPLADKLG